MERVVGRVVLFGKRMGETNGLRELVLYNLTSEREAYGYPRRDVWARLSTTSYVEGHGRSEG